MPTYEIQDVAALVGRRQPGIYDSELSAYAMEIGLAVHREVGLELLYVSLTDYVQHKLSVAANACTALGTSADKHDLSHLGDGLRSHGGPLDYCEIQAWRSFKTSILSEEPLGLKWFYERENRND